MARKQYCIDTSVLLENPKSIEILRNGEENDIMLSEQTILELDKHKANPRLSHIVKEVTDELLKYKEIIKVLAYPSTKSFDDKILHDILKYLEDSELPPTKSRWLPASTTI